MLETMLSFGADAKKSQLTSELFYKDDAGNMESTLIVAERAECKCVATSSSRSTTG